MKSQLKAKLLQHFAGKKANGGFTLIELLVVIIIIGILSAIALPSFLNQANKARQSEAKTYIGSMNRGQQAYYLEFGEFSVPRAAVSAVVADPTANPPVAAVAARDAVTLDQALADLGLGIALATDNYAYQILAEGQANSVGAINEAIPLATANAAAGSNDSSVKAYIGGVKVGTINAVGGSAGEATTLASLCEAARPPLAGGSVPDANTTFGASMQGSTDGAPVCPSGYKSIK